MVCDFHTRAGAVQYAPRRPGGPCGDLICDLGICVGTGRNRVRSALSIPLAFARGTGLFAGNSYFVSGSTAPFTVC